MNSKVVDELWMQSCQDQDDIIRSCEQIKELCFMRDTHNTGILTVPEISTIIKCLCTE